MWCLLQTYEGYTGDSCAFSHRVRVPLHQPYGHSPSLRLSNRDGAKVRRRMAHILVRGRPKTTEYNFRRAPVIKFFSDDMRLFETIYMRQCVNFNLSRGDTPSFTFSELQVWKCNSFPNPVQGRLRATPRPSGSAVCMHTSDASESQTCPLLGAALTDANFTLRARAARRARPTSWAVRASHKNMGVSADFFPQFEPPKRYIHF